jgi:hypothetical protein
MSFYQRNTISSNPQHSAFTPVRKNNNSVMQNTINFATPNDYYSLMTKDGKRLGWFFKQTQPSYRCLHNQEMILPDGTYMVVCSNTENCGSKVFEGTSSVLSACVRTADNTLGIVPLTFCKKTANLHITLSNVRGSVVMKCPDTTCPVIETSIDCQNVLICPDKLAQSLCKAAGIRDHLTRMQYLLKLFEIVKSKNFVDLEKIEYPQPIFQNTLDLIELMSGCKKPNHHPTSDVDVVFTPKEKWAVPAVPTKRSKPKSSAVEKSKKVKRSASPVFVPKPILEVVSDTEEIKTDDDTSSSDDE